MNDNNEPSQLKLNQARAFVRKLARKIWDNEEPTLSELEALMVEHGMLIALVEIEPCGPDCFCLREHGELHFPLTCYKLAAEWL